MWQSADVTDLASQKWTEIRFHAITVYRPSIARVSSTTRDAAKISRIVGTEKLALTKRATDLTVPNRRRYPTLTHDWHKKKRKRIRKTVRRLRAPFSGFGRHLFSSDAPKRALAESERGADLVTSGRDRRRRARPVCAGLFLCVRSLDRWTAAAAAVAAACCRAAPEGRRRRLRERQGLRCC